MYFPWYNEQTDLLGDYSTYEEHYIVHTNKVSTMKLMLIADQDGPSEHLSSQIALSTEVAR